MTNYNWFIIGFIIIFLFLTLFNSEGICSDLDMPNGAIEFAYGHMIIKDNVTFVKIEPNNFENACSRHYWVTDTEGVTYRLVWSKMHHTIKLNTPYTIHYVGRGIFNALWEFE